MKQIFRILKKIKIKNNIELSDIENKDIKVPIYNIFKKDFNVENFIDLIFINLLLILIVINDRNSMIYNKLEMLIYFIMLYFIYYHIDLLFNKVNLFKAYLYTIRLIKNNELNYKNLDHIEMLFNLIVKIQYILIFIFIFDINFIKHQGYFFYLFLIVCLLVILYTVFNNFKMKNNNFKISNFKRNKKK